MHTDQHCDEALSALCFESLGIPLPNFNLTVGFGSQVLQTARIMERLEPVLLEQTPD